MSGASFPSSYIKTTSSAVSRAADYPSFPISFGPQEMTVYTKFKNTGFTQTMSGATRRLWQIGNWPAGPNASIVSPNESSDDLQGLFYGDNNHLTGSIGGGSWGDIVEARYVIPSTVDRCTLGVSVNGGAENTSDSTVDDFSPSSWEQKRIFVGSDAGDKHAFADYISGPLIAPGVKSMNEMRNLAGTA